MIPLEINMLYFVNLRKDKYSLNILLVAAEKALTRKWLSKHSPTLNGWMDISMDIYNMGKITASVNHTLVNLLQPVRSGLTL